METCKAKRISALNYIQAIYDFGFVTFMIPYRVVWSESKGYTLYSNLIQKIISSFIQFIIIYETTVYIILAIRKDILESGIHYLIYGHILVCLVFRLVCIRIFWFRRRILKLLRKVEHLKFLNDTPATSRKVTCIAYGIMLWMFCFAIAELLSINFTTATQAYMGGKIGEVVNEAKILYLHREITNTSRMGNLNLKEERHGTSFMEAVAVCIHFLGILPHYICMASLEKNILVIVLLCRHIVMEFVKYAKKNENHMEMVLCQYVALKEVIFSVNETFGLMTLIQIGACLPFYPTWTGIVIFKEEQTWFESIQFVSFFGTFFMVLAVAADVNSKVGEFYKWVSSLTLSKGISAGISSEKLAALNIDMYSEQVAITGAGFFNITYRFLGTVLSIVITYTVVVIQFQSPES